MTRKRKNRRIHKLPPVNEFLPKNGHTKLSPVTLTLDEYETIRLMDLEGFSQAECSMAMDIARSTVQQIYARARKKLAEAIVLGKPFKIDGGNCEMCDGHCEFCKNDVWANTKTACIQPE